ncbi:hypothetical protein ACSTS3_10540 [Aquimarina muelleri]|uniref:hypothetical protein n=1 Tax=Aquimarina muelleri TaxID=279356 RepID=UPI003F682946
MSLPHQILEYPNVVNKERISKSGKGILLRADDKTYLESHAYKQSVGVEFGGGAIVIGVWLGASAELSSQYIVPAIFTLGGVFWVVYGIFVNKKYKIFELNRLEGTVAYPDRFFNPPLEGKFKDLKAVISVSGNIDGYADSEYLKFVNTFKPRKLDLLYTFYGSDPQKDWSFYVWYMDKNRPLPLGTAFDPYRQQDFERRKAEGFPRPLYPSDIPTPEATPEQQKERRLIGGW